MIKVVALLAIVTTWLAAPAALAQVRDPFQPLVDPDAGTGTSVEGEVAPAVQPLPAAPDEPLPDTGSESSPYLAVAFVLICLGLAAMAIARLHSKEFPLKV